MNIGERHELDGDWFEVTASGSVSGEDFVFEDGRLPEEGERGKLILPDEEEGVAYWVEPVEQVEKRERVSRLEMEMDTLLGPVRAELLRYDDDVPLEKVASMLRVAAAQGYMHALTEEPRGALASRSGYTVEGVH